MEIFKLPEKELKEMKQFYLEEYDRSRRRLQHIVTILKRLEVEIPEQYTDGFSPEAPSPGSPKIAGTKTTKTKKKSGRKSKWELLITKRLRQLDKPVTYDQLTDEIMAFSKLPAEKRTSTKQAVVNVIFRLRNRDRKVDTFSMGTREKYIALRSWFESPGVIKKEYAARVKPLKKARK